MLPPLKSTLDKSQFSNTESNKSIFCNEQSLKITFLNLQESIVNPFSCK